MELYDQARPGQHALISGGRARPSAFASLPPEACAGAIPTCFEARVRQAPQGIAVKAGMHILTYTALNALANRIAHAILARRGPDAEPVAMLLGKDRWFVATFLGILKAGKMYVPLDPLYPPARTRFICDDVQAALLVTTTQHLDFARSLVSAETPILNLDTLATTLSEDNPELPLRGDTLAYVLYTSGSTGQPKGVLQNHRNLVHNIVRYANSLALGAGDRLSLLWSSSSMGSPRDMLAAVLTGATIYPYDLPRDGLAQLGPWLQQEQITFLNIVATPFRHFVRTLDGSEQFPSLRLIKLGSESVSLQDVALYKQHFSAACVLYIGFGSTETGNGTQYLMGQQTPLSGPVVPAGYPLAGMEVRVVDEHGVSLGPNQVGEIMIRSRYLALGYWRRPDLTAAAFLPDPEGGEARMYRTGDLGRLRPDGCLEVLGRRDAQVKIRGYRVEVTEVELALLALPSLKQAAVVARERRGGDLHLVAYVVPVQPPGPTAAELRQFLRVQLPAHMVPSIFMTLPILPATPQGKVDRRALPDPDWGLLASASASVAPRTPIETELARLWAEVLDLEGLGIHDLFLDIGGNSLLASQLVTRVRDAFQLDLPLPYLLASATIADMAVMITQHLAAQTTGDELARWLDEVEKPQETGPGH